MAKALQLKVFLAGGVAVEADGAVISEGRFPGRQGRLLFAYLTAEQGRPVPRDELADARHGPGARCTTRSGACTSPPCACGSEASLDPV
jgi:hypothetical protein